MAGAIPIEGAADALENALAAAINDDLPTPKPVQRKWRPKQNLWLNTEPNWKTRIGDGWVGQKMLGQGGQGMVGHWKYEGIDRDEKTVKDLAVKQAVYPPANRRGLAPDSGGLLREAAFYTLFQPHQTPHIPRMYTHMYEDGGGNTGILDEGTVHRIFLEFCEGGSLSHWHSKYMDAPGGRLPVSEDELWAVFHCLSRSLLTIEMGSEEIGNANWTDKEICHFDLKLDNVFVTRNLTDLEHMNMPAFKIGDFGCAKDVPKTQAPRYQRNNDRRGTPLYLLPEQIQPGHPRELQRPWNYVSLQTGTEKILTYAHRSRYGTASNVWQTGLIMYIIMMQPRWQAGGYSFDWLSGDGLGNYHSELNHKLRQRGRTLATLEQIALEQAGQDLKYSKALHALVAECLLLIPDERPTPTDLVKETGSQLLIAKMTSRAAPVGTLPRHSFLNQFREPTLSDRWYSGQKRPGDVLLHTEAAERDDDWLIVPAQPAVAVAVAAKVNPAPTLQSQARGIVRSLARRNSVRRANAAQGSVPALAIPQQPLPSLQTAAGGLREAQAVLDNATRPGARSAAAFEPRTNAPLLAPNLASRTTYKNITFVVDRGLFRGNEQYDFGSLDTHNTVYDRKVLLSRRVGILAKDMIFKAGGRVMENDKMLADYPILETHGVIDVAQL